jgi:hypothetical protein
MGDLRSAVESFDAETSTKHLQDVSKSLAQSVVLMPEMADRHGFRSYWRKSAPRQAEIAVAYILEAFDELGLDIRGMKAGEVIGDIDALPRHAKVVERYFHLLQKYGVIERSQGQWVRTPNRALDTSSDALVEKFTREFPQHASETKMISITGPNLAAVLNGMEDPMELLFGNAESSEAVGDCYSNGAMFATSIDLVADVVRRSVAGGNKDVVRIIEIGAGCKCNS